MASLASLAECGEVALDANACSAGSSRDADACSASLEWRRASSRALHAWACCSVRAGPRGAMGAGASGAMEAAASGGMGTGASGGGLGLRCTKIRTGLGKSPYMLFNFKGSPVARSVRAMSCWRQPFAERIQSMLCQTTVSKGNENRCSLVLASKRFAQPFSTSSLHLEWLMLVPAPASSVPSLVLFCCCLVCSVAALGCAASAAANSLLLAPASACSVALLALFCAGRPTIGAGSERERVVRCAAGVHWFCPSGAARLRAKPSVVAPVSSGRTCGAWPSREPKWLRLVDGHV